jgi:hypothetical protein
VGLSDSVSQGHWGMMIGLGIWGKVVKFEWSQGPALRRLKMGRMWVSGTAASP